MKNIFIIGSKGIPAQYGGFETFVDRLTEYSGKSDYKYHVSCMAKDSEENEYHGARCYNIKVPSIGPARAVYYDVKAFDAAIEYCKMNPKIKEPIMYVLACRIGPFFSKRVKAWHKLGGKVYVNPDGHEWKRGKWNYWIKRYWKLSERMMVKYADLLVCDSKNIEAYIHEDYEMYRPRTTYIAYGTDTASNSNCDDDYEEWLRKNSLKKNEYYLIVGRFVPENNFEVMIREFMKSDSKKKLVIITTSNRKYQKELNGRLQFERDDRVQFVGTVYDKELLCQIRMGAYGYLHGHEVGGTNPSLLEALGSTKLNLLLDVGFNKEVAEDTALYWTKEENSLRDLLNQCENMKDERDERGKRARDRMQNLYSWEFITSQYEKIWK